MQRHAIALHQPGLGEREGSRAEGADVRAVPVDAPESVEHAAIEVLRRVASGVSINQVLVVQRQVNSRHSRNTQRRGRRAGAKSALLNPIESRSRRTGRVSRN
jgi:hypothetical protein